MKEQLIAITIGKEANKNIDPSYKASVFKQYIEKAFPSANIKTVEPISTPASLNSVCAYVDLTTEKGEDLSAFAKIHIESNTQSTNTLGAEGEYAQANLLVQYGWPVVTPIMHNDSKEYPLLLYPKITDKTLFDLFEESYDKNANRITNRDLDILSRLNNIVGERMVDSVKTANAKEAAFSPVQTLFMERFKANGRIDQWYKPETQFNLPGLDSSISWRDLLKGRWVINGVEYDTTLEEIVENARKYLSFGEEQSVPVCVSHGDDHAGNIFMQQERALLFDPAFAGWNPTSLSNAKALAHNCFLPMGGMYYDPKMRSSYEFSKSENAIRVNIPFESFILYNEHETLAKQIIDLRILPLTEELKKREIETQDEAERIKYALCASALLTINVATLLEQKDGRGEGLLPLTIMFSQLKGFPSLFYMKEELQKV